MSGAAAVLTARIVKSRVGSSWAGVGEPESRVANATTTAPGRPLGAGMRASLAASAGRALVNFIDVLEPFYMTELLTPA